VSIFAWLQTIRRPVLFILLSSLVFLLGRDLFVVPVITADLFGRKWATTNYGVVYTSKGTAAIFAAPVAAFVMAKEGSWCRCLRHDWLRYPGALLALFALKPLAKRTIAQVDLLEQKAEAEESWRRLSRQ